MTLLLTLLSWFACFLEFGNTCDDFSEDQRLALERLCIIRAESYFAKSTPSTYARLEGTNGVFQHVMKTL
jgi:hypothetical protein